MAADEARSYPQFSDWLKNGHAGEMKYLEETQELRRKLSLVFPEYQSHLILTASYKPHPQRKSHLPGIQIASYAQGADYHVWLRQILEAIAQKIQHHFPEARFRFGTDVLPVLERDFAAQAGLGWIGKNTCLIHPKKGSYHFIAEILTNIPLANSAKPTPLPDFCGKCNRCIEACPTGALESPRKLNATKCISYWTIESKSLPPENLRKRMGSWFFGCDICQDVCPWNDKIFGKERKTAPKAVAGSDLIDSLRWILTASNRVIEAQLRDSPLLRARPFGLRRNALQVVGNLRLKELEPEVKSLLDHPRLGPMATWTLEQLLE